jgi:hypothetical protein
MWRRRMECNGKGGEPLRIGLTPCICRGTVRDPIVDHKKRTANVDQSGLPIRTRKGARRSAPAESNSYIPHVYWIWPGRVWVPVTRPSIGLRARTGNGTQPAIDQGAHHHEPSRTEMTRMYSGVLLAVHMGNGNGVGRAVRRWDTTWRFGLSRRLFPTWIGCPKNARYNRPYCESQTQ